MSATIVYTKNFPVKAYYVASSAQEGAPLGPSVAVSIPARAGLVRRCVRVFHLGKTGGGAGDPIYLILGGQPLGATWAGGQRLAAILTNTNDTFFLRESLAILNSSAVVSQDFCVYEEYYEQVPPSD